MAPQSSSSDLQFSKEKIEYPTSKNHKFSPPIEYLIGMFEVLFSLSPLQKKNLKITKEKYLRDKSSGFQCEPESHCRCLFHFPMAHLVLRDGKFEGDVFFGCVRDDDDDNDVTEKNWNLTLMGKQFLLKCIELGTIEADLNKVSVLMADWALSNGGHRSSFILLIDSISFLKRTVNVIEPNGQQEKFFRDKINGFQCEPESNNRELFHFPMAHLVLRDGKIEGDIFFGCVRDDDDEDDDDEEDEEEEDDDDDDEEEDLNLILMGKQFLLKFIELGTIEADLNKTSVQIADWAIYKNGGHISCAIMLIYYITFLKRTAEVIEANGHQETKVWTKA